MAKKSEPSGISSVDPPEPGATPAEAVEHYLSGYEQRFAHARRIVKRRASGVTVAIAILTGALAVLGSIGALLSADWLSASIAIATTVISATVSVLLAWNDHFHHRELWIQRSTVLAEINSLHRRYAVNSKQPWYMRRAANTEAAITLRKLDKILERDLESWTQIQTRYNSSLLG